MWPWRRSGARRLAAAAAALVALSVAAALGSCASVPSARAVRRPPLDPARFGLFPASPFYFAFRMTPLVRAAAGRLLPGSGPPAFLKRADTLYGATETGAAGRLYGAAEGRFSPAALRLALACSRDWRRVRGSRDRWRAADGSLEAAVPGAGLLLFGSGDLSPMVERVAAAPGFAMPPAAAAALAGADLYGYLPAVPSGAAGGLPLRGAWVAFREDGGRFDGEVALLLDGESGGRLAALGVRALLTRVLRDAGVADSSARLRATSVQAEAGLVRVGGLILAAGEIAAVVESLGGRAR